MTELKPTEQRREIVKELRSLANQVQSLLVVDPDLEEQGEVLPVGIKFIGSVGCCWLYHEHDLYGGVTFDPTEEQRTEALDLLSDWFKRCVEAGSFHVPEKNTDQPTTTSP